MKNLVKTMGQYFVSATFVIGALISSGACFGPYYQPKLPKKLQSK